MNEIDLLIQRRDEASALYDKAMRSFVHEANDTTGHSRCGFTLRDKAALTGLYSKVNCPDCLLIRMAALDQKVHDLTQKEEGDESE